MLDRLKFWRLRYPAKVDISPAIASVVRGLLAEVNEAMAEAGISRARRDAILHTATARYFKPVVQPIPPEKAPTDV